jgi:hypothetical protein
MRLHRIGPEGGEAMQIIWGSLRLLERYVTGDQWGPLVKLYAQTTRSIFT